MHNWSILITVQRDATQSSLFIIMLVPSTCFWCQPHPLSEVHKTVTTASSTGHIFLQLAPSNVAQLHPSGSCTKNMNNTGGCSYSLRNPDDGCGWHPKHVEWTYRIINRLHCVASRWTITNIDFLWIHLHTWIHRKQCNCKSLQPLVWCRTSRLSTNSIQHCNQYELKVRGGIWNTYIALHRTFEYLYGEAILSEFHSFISSPSMYTFRWKRL